MCHETRSLVFPEQLPVDYLAMLFEALPQLEYLASVGRNSEDYMLPYVGQERHEELEPLLRPSACGTRAGCPNAVHIMFTTGCGSKKLATPYRHRLRRRQRRSGGRLGRSTRAVERRLMAALIERAEDLGQ